MKTRFIHKNDIRKIDYPDNVTGIVCMNEKLAWSFEFGLFMLGMLKKHIDEAYNSINDVKIAIIDNHDQNYPMGVYCIPKESSGRRERT